MERETAQDLIQRHGGRVTGSVSKKTSYIVIGDDAGESKLKKVSRLVFVATVLTDGSHFVIARVSEYVPP